MKKSYKKEILKLSHLFDKFNIHDENPFRRFLGSHPEHTGDCPFVLRPFISTGEYLSSFPQTRQKTLIFSLRISLSFNKQSSTFASEILFPSSVHSRFPIFAPLDLSMAFSRPSWNFLRFFSLISALFWRSFSFVSRPIKP